MWGCCSCFSKTYEAPEVLELDYRHASLAEVPADVFSYERTLEKLDLGSNQISDLPPSLFHCHELKELDLCDNDLMSIPPAVGSLTRLCKLDLSRNAITEVADSIKNCKSLVYLDLSLNHLSKLPEGISQLVNLEELFLNDTYLEFLHANFGRLTKLKVLELRENSLQSLPKSMTRLHHLQRLDVGQNDLLEMPEVVGTMTNLTELWCDNNSMRSIPKFIGSLTKLNCLDASQNDIQEIADEISKCILLNDLSLNTNSLESLPDSFPKLECLSVLRLDCNSIQYLPEDFGNLKSLEELSLVRNILKTLPASIGLLRKLHTMYLDDNLLAELPIEIGSCAVLSVLSVAKNRLTEIPSEVGHLSNLKVLTLSGNLIVHLPVSILNIPKLGALWLSESQSKPLLPLNKEIDPPTGQHVLTCYLLPQLPSSVEDNRRMASEEEDVDGNVPPRRSRPSIKFVTDSEPPVVDNNVNKRGLLRAPTPYPKELRALAKHASHLRQSKDQNGEIINTDEPEYEGDYTEEEIMQSDARDGRGPLPIRKSSVQEQNSNQVNGGLIHGPQFHGAGHAATYQNLIPQAKDYAAADSEARHPSHSHNERERIGLPSVGHSIGRTTVPYLGSYSSSSSSVMGSGGPPVPPHATHPVETILSKIEETNKRGSDLAQNLPSANVLINDATRFAVVSDTEEKSSSNYGNTGSELARKSPPPYHVAARRAAFFRTSGSPSSISSSGPGDVQSRMSPLISSRAINQVGPSLTNAESAGFSNAPPGMHPNIPQLPSNSHSSSTHPQHQFQHSVDNRQVSSNDFGKVQGGGMAGSPFSTRSKHSTSGDDGNNEDESILSKTYVVSKEELREDSEVISSQEVIDHRGNYVDHSKTFTVIESKTETGSIREYVDQGGVEEIEQENEEWYKENKSKEIVVSSVAEDGITVESVTTSTTSSLSETKLSTSVEVNTVKNQENGLKSSNNFLSSSGVSSASNGTQSNIALYSVGAGTTRSVPFSNLPLSPSSNLNSYGFGSRAGPFKGRSTTSPETPTMTATTLTSTSGVSPTENFSKIPVFATQSKLNLKPEVELPSQPIPGVNAIHRAGPIPPTAPPVKNYASSSNQGSGDSGGVVNAGGGSRIPKLPSFSTMPAPSSTVATSGESHLPTFPKKPDIIGPKPTLTRTIIPSRIPSVLGDPKAKDQVSFKDSNIKHTGGPKATTSMPSVGVSRNNAPTNIIAPGVIVPSNINVPTVPVSYSNNVVSQVGLTTRIPRFGDPERPEIKRTISGSRIPKLHDAPTFPSPPPPTEVPVEHLENLPEATSSSLSINIPGGGGSKIPMFGNARKPWIFGTHKNARVVPVEYRKGNNLKFTVSDGQGVYANPDGQQGIYVDFVENADSTIKLGDKILQVDGIDVSNMSIDIVRRILGNCQENINLLVSRQN